MHRNLFFVAILLTLVAILLMANLRPAGSGDLKAATAKPDFVGQFSIGQPDHVVDCTCQWYTTPVTGSKDRMVITAQTDNGPVTSELQWDRGDRFFDYAEPEFDGLCIHWFQGAGSTGLSVIALDKDFKAHEIFHDRCRFGYQILNVMGDETPEICAGVGDLNRLNEMKVYQWNGKTFVLAQTVPTYEVHRYDIHAVTTQPAGQ